MLRFIILIFLMMSCSFKPQKIADLLVLSPYADLDDDGVNDAFEEFFGFDYKKVDISPSQSKFFRRAIIESHFDLSNLKYVSFDNAESDIEGKAYSLGKLSSKDQLFLLLTPNLFSATKFKNKELRRSGCLIKFRIPFIEEIPLEFNQKFDGVLKDIVIDIGIDKYSLNELYDRGVIDDSWGYDSGDSVKLQIIIRDLSKIKDFKEEEVYLTLYPSIKSNTVGGYEYKLDHNITIEDKKYLSCLNFFIESARKERIGLIFKFSYLTMGRNGHLSFIPRTVIDGLKTVIKSENDNKEFYQNYSIGFNSIIIKNKELK